MNAPPRTRWPLRYLAVLFLLGLIGLGGWLAWQVCAVEYHIAAAASSARRYHNLQAQHHLDRCLALRPHEPRALLLAARVAWRLGSFDLSERLLDQYQEARGGDDDHALEHVLLRAARGDVAEVEAYCRARIEEDHPAAGLVHEAVAAGLVRRYRLREADDALRAWQQREPDNTQALLQAGNLCELRLQLPEALERYRRAVELDPARDEARLRLVGVLVHNNSGQEALPHAEYLRRCLPDNPRVHLLLAQCQALLGRQDEAARTLDELLRRWPHHGPALGERGKLALRDGDAVRAEALLREALARDPASTTTRHLLAQALRRNGKEEQARAEEDRLAQMNEDEDRIQKIALVEMQQRPNDPALCAEVGVISLRAGAVSEGLRWLRRALEIDPGNAAAHRALEDHYQRAGNATLAARHRRQAAR
jgi:Flp pilus assembly protein TadD